jgi:hypothetical protein
MTKKIFRLVVVMLVAMAVFGPNFATASAHSEAPARNTPAVGWPPTVVYNYSSISVIACDNNTSNQPVNCRWVGAGQIEYNDVDWLIVPVSFDLYQSVGFKGSFAAYTGLRYSDGNAVYIYDAGSGRVSVHGWGSGYIQIR